jgi:hypothetical protein
VVKMIVDRGANVRLKNKKVRTASDKAHSRGIKNMADWLDSLRRGKDR